MNLYRLIKIIFVILLVVTIGELGYYVYIRSFRAPKQDTSQVNVQPPISLPPINSQINQTMLGQLGRLQTPVTEEISVSTKHKGRITDIKSYTDQPNFVFRIIIEEQSSNFTFLFTPISYQKLKVMNKKSETITYQGLKIGDTIELVSTLSLMGKCDSDQCYKEVIITDLSR